MRPLDGLVVLDFSTLLPGPMATATLQECGAEVVKIERPGGEDMRRFPTRLGEVSAPYAALNRGKRILSLDLKAEGARERLEPEIMRADILVEQFRPGVMERLGLGYEALVRLNPRLIYCSITGFGHRGPRSGEAGHDINYQALSGLLGQSLNAGVADPLPPPLVADIAGGAMAAVTNILLALRERDVTGRGCHLDIAMSDTMATFLWYAIAEASVTGRAPEGGEGLLTGASPRYGLYRTADGRFLAVGALEEKFWLTLCEALALPDALRDDAANPLATRETLAAIVAGHDAAHWRARLERLDCCCTIVATLAEAMADPHWRARGLDIARSIAPDGTPVAAAPLPLAPHFRERQPARMPVAET